jgi:hypothetical protein
VIASVHEGAIASSTLFAEVLKLALGGKVAKLSPAATQRLKHLLNVGCRKIFLIQEARHLLAIACGVSRWRSLYSCLSATG